MVKFLLWCILFVLCWPIALLGLIIYPVVWLLLLPFRLIGITIRGVLELFKALSSFPRVCSVIDQAEFGRRSAGSATVPAAIRPAATRSRTS